MFETLHLYKPKRALSAPSPLKKIKTVDIHLKDNNSLTRRQETISNKLQLNLSISNNPKS